MQEIFYFIKTGLSWFLDIIFPVRCLECKKTNQILCSTCIEKIKLTERQTVDDILAVYDYRDPIIKKAIWELKYHHSPIVGQKLGQLLYNEFLEEIINLQMFSGGSSIYVIPIPISNNRKKHRGYNQSEIIAKSFCDSCENKILELKNNIIIKKIDTIAQAKLTNRTKRLKNLKGVFEIKNPQRVIGKTIIVVDDVTTTGATMTEIIKILKKSGAKKVIGFAIAH